MGAAGDGAGASGAAASLEAGAPEAVALGAAAAGVEDAAASGTPAADVDFAPVACAGAAACAGDAGDAGDAAVTPAAAAEFPPSGEAAAAAGVPYLAVLPYPDADKAWPAEGRRHFAELLAGAKETITLDRRPPESKQKAGAALARRDGWLVAHADEAVVVWDDEDPFVGRTVRSFRDRLGEENVWVLEP